MKGVIVFDLTAKHLARSSLSWADAHHPLWDVCEGVTTWVALPLLGWLALVLGVWRLLNHIG